MTNINRPESESSTRDVPGFDGITFEVEEEEHTQEGQKVKRRGIYLCLFVPNFFRLTEKIHEKTLK